MPVFVSQYNKFTQDQLWKSRPLFNCRLSWMALGSTTAGVNKLTYSSIDNKVSLLTMGIHESFFDISRNLSYWIFRFMCLNVSALKHHISNTRGLRGLERNLFNLNLICYFFVESRCSFVHLYP